MCGDPVLFTRDAAAAAATGACTRVYHSKEAELDRGGGGGGGGGSDLARILQAALRDAQQAVARPCGEVCDACVATAAVAAVSASLKTEFASGERMWCEHLLSLALVRGSASALRDAAAAGAAAAALPSRPRSSLSLLVRQRMCCCCCCCGGGGGVICVNTALDAMAGVLLGVACVMLRGARCACAG